MNYALALACVCLTFLASRGAVVAESVHPNCPVALPLVKLGTTLPATAAAMRRGNELVVVAIGSSSTSGVGASDRRHTYPARLEAELQQRWPRQHVRVINKGVGGEDADQMIGRFKKDVLSNNPDLVIWQAGTNLMLRSGSADSLLSLLRTGVRTLKTDHIDVVLMDPQFAPKVTDVPNYPKYVSTIEQAAHEQHIGLFHRFALMRNWIQGDEFAVNDIISPDKLHMNDISYTCVARALAAGIADAVQATPVTMAIQNDSVSAR